MSRVIFWHLLTRGEDYAYARPSLTAAKLRRIELLAGAPRRQGQRGKTTRPYRLQQVRDRERELSAQAERAYQRLVADSRPQPNGAGAAPGARITRALYGASSAADISPNACALARGRPRHREPSHRRPSPTTRT